MAREDPQLKFRVPAELRAQLEEAASATGRSLSAEIVQRLEQSFDLREQDVALIKSLSFHSERAARQVADAYKKREGVEADPSYISFYEEKLKLEAMMNIVIDQAHRFRETLPDTADTNDTTLEHRERNALARYKGRPEEATAWTNGSASFRHQFAITQNPYREDTAKHIAWLEGYNFARLEDGQNTDTRPPVTQRRSQAAKAVKPEVIKRYTINPARKRRIQQLRKRWAAKQAAKADK